MTHTLDIEVQRTKHSKLAETDFSNLEFGAKYADHMFVVDYVNKKWEKPRIIPFQNFSMSPASAVLHYGQSIFEGLKAYRAKKGEILVFRPQAHHTRLNTSAKRLC